MLNNASGIDHIYIACGYTDLRSGIDRLAALVQSSFKLDPYQNSLFPFCGRRTDRIKGLLWEGDGFLLLYKRLETGSFQWPRSESGCGPQTSVSLMERTIAPNVSTWAASTRGEPEPPRVTNTFPLLLRSGEYPREDNSDNR